MSKPKPTPPAFQFYASDFLTSTAEMTHEEVGMYIRLLCHQWVNGSVNKSRAHRILHCKIPNEVLERFVEKDGELRNTRLEHERAKQAAYKEKQAASGRDGADKRWGKGRYGDTISDPIATPLGDNVESPSNCQWQNDSSSSSSSHSSPASPFFSEKGSVDASRQTPDGTPSASDDSKKEQDQLGSFYFSTPGDAKRQPQELAQQQEIVGDQPDWMLSPSEIEDEKAFIESAGTLLDRWQKARTGKRGVVRIRTLKTGKAILGDISPNDKKALRSFLPHRLEVAIEALDSIDGGAIGFNANPIGFYFFSNNIDRILAGSLAEFESRKPIDTKTSQAESMMSELEHVLSKSNSQQSQQKVISHE